MTFCEFSSAPPPRNESANRLSEETKNAATANAVRTLKSDAWFRAAVLPYELPLRRYLRRHFSSISETDDLVQEVYVRLFRCNAPIANMRGWLHQTVRHIALDFLRRRRSRRTVEMPFDELAAVRSHEPSVTRIVSARQEMALARQALLQLPRRCQQVTDLRLLRGFTTEEISALLGISRKTVRAHLELGVPRYRAELAALGIHGPPRDD